MKKAINFSIKVGLYLFFLALFLPQCGLAALINFKLIGGGGAGNYYGTLENNKLTIYNQKEDSLLAGFYFYFENKDVNVNYSGAGFKSPATPSFLPELYAPPKKADTSFGFSRPEYRIGYGESITFEFNNDFDNDELLKLFMDDHIMVGIFVQDYIGGESANFVSSAVPVPASIVLLMSGLTGMIWMRKRLKREE